MAQVAIRLIFWKSAASGDTVEVGKQLCTGTIPTALAAIDATRLLAELQATRGFARLAIDDRSFSLDNPRAEVSMDGDIHARHFDVRFHGNFETLAKPLFQFMSRQGLLCYVQGDRDLLRAWPTFKEPEIEQGYAARMERVLQRRNDVLRTQEPDSKRRKKLMTEYLRSEAFRNEMARAHGLETKIRNGSATVDVILAAAGEKKIQVIKVVGQHAGLGLKEAKDLVDAAPTVVLAGVDRARAQRVREALEEQCARVEAR